MRYRLVVTTDGRPEVLEQTLDSFRARVQQRPVEGVIVDDSGDPSYRRYLDALLNDRSVEYGERWRLVSHTHRQGFCETVADAWALAAEPGVDWVWWSEDDFVYERPVDMGLFAYILDREPQVAQMALYRNPVSDAEKAAGGYVPLYRSEYQLRGSGAVAWLETSRNWTTNPSLFRRQLAIDHPWPVRDECEGHFGAGLRDAGHTFGIWGIGDQDYWVRHIGERVGAGY